MKKCQAANCGYNVFSNGFCIRHQHLRNDEKYVLKNMKPSILKKPRQGTSRVFRIRKVSSKMSKSLKVYHSKRIIYLDENPVCQFPSCMEHAVDIHHTKGRGIYLNETATWKSVCRTHHDWIHNNPKEAEEKGMWTPISKR